MKKKVLLLGWDAADWKMINPMIDEGLMPALESIVNKGSMGNLSTLDPPFSPTLWTSIATGKRPYKHGIHGFIEPDPSGEGVRPVHITSRKVRAIWNILCNEGYKCHQVGWWPSHPAEPINGVYISNFYQRANAPITEPWPVVDGTIHPKEKENLFASLRLHPQELTGAHLKPFLPNGHLMDQNDPLVRKRIESIQKILADCTTIHSAATYILENEEWDFMAVYLDALDHFSHGFMKFNPPRRPHINEKDFENYKEVVKSGYRYHDMMLATLLDLIPEDTTIILLSDHGFYPNHLRPLSLPKESAGPAYEHSPYGIIVVKGPGIKEDTIIHGASLLDITPTILHHLDLPVGLDMDGKVLNNIFKQNRKIKTIPSYEDLEGDFYELPKGFKEDPEVSKEALKQLVDLGYIAAPGPDIEKEIARVTRDTNFYKARSYIDGGIYSEAIKLLEELHEEIPENNHYSIRLANCYLQINKTGKARKTVQTIRKHQSQDTIMSLVMQARVLLQEKSYDKALGYINDAIALRADAPGLKMYKGEILIELGKFSEAENIFNEEIARDPENNMAHHSMGKVYYALGKYAESVDSYLSSIGLQFLSPQTHYRLGLSLEKLEIYDAAANAYKNCIHILKNHKKAKKRLIDIFENKLNKPKLAAAIQATLPDYTLPEMIIVSGLPRSGTSMMMQMIEASGIEVFSDGIRTADENNKKGYYEHERIKYLPTDITILKQVGDRVVKIVAPLLFHLPKNYRYKIIFMEREMGEILLSQHKMLKRNKVKKKQDVFSFKLWKKFEEVIDRIKSTYKDERNISLLFVQHRDVIEDPLSVAREVSTFLDRDLDITKMASVVDNTMYREREAHNPNQ